MRADESNRETTIYALCDPDTGAIRYIGKSVDVARRYKSHLSARDYQHTPIRRWVAKVKRAGKVPTLRVLEVCGEDWVERERHWIAASRAAGADLLNLSDGGDGAPGVRRTAEQRAASSRLAKAQGRRPPSHLRKSAQTFLGHTHTDEARQRISDARQGMRFPDAHRQALRESKQAFFAAHPEAREALSRRYAALTDEQVREVYRLAHEAVVPQREIAQRFGIPASTVSDIKNRKRYVHALTRSDN